MKHLILLWFILDMSTGRPLTGQTFLTPRACARELRLIHYPGLEYRAVCARVA